jgi:methionyl-tRNA synthetase
MVDEQKMSKSRGNVINPMAFVDRYGVDPFRYFLMAEMSLGQDASFTEEGFVLRYNAELANGLGNLLNRVMKLIASHCDQCVPSGDGAGPDEDALKTVAVRAAGTVVDAVERLKLDAGLAETAEVVREANRYMEKTEPWALAKQGETGRLHTVLYHAAEALRVVSGLLYPVMPGKMLELRTALGLGAEAPKLATLRSWGVLEPGTRIGAMPNLFPRIKLPRQAGAGQRDRSSAPKRKAEVGIMTIGFDDFKKVQLRTARVVSAERVEGADKLLKLQIALGGDETRQIVAGIAQHYQPEELPGKTIVVVANLEPARIRGVESNGMLLAAASGDSLRLVTVDGDADPGAEVR